MALLTSRTLATGVTINDLFHIVKPYDVSQNPAGSSYKASVQQLFDSLSGYCLSDIYVTNIHSCSPLNINPLDEGNVYFGSTSGVTIDVINKRIGLNTDTPSYLIDFFNSSTDTRIYFAESSNVRDFRVTGVTNNLTTIGVSSLDGLGNPTGILIGVRGLLDPTWAGYGKVNDTFVYSSNQANGLNLISRQGILTEDYIRFYAGQDANGTISDIHIQGSGSTRGFVGIGTDTPTEKLEVNGGDILIENGNSSASTDLDSTIRRLIVTTTSSTGLTELVTSVDYPSLGGFGGVLLGTIGENAVLGGIVPERGKQGDSYLYAGARVNGLNIINKENPSSTEDYIRFYAGQDANGTISDIHIQGTGTTRGYVGMGTESPLVKLHVSGDTIVSDGLTADTLNISSTPNIDSNLYTQFLTRDSLTGDVKIKQTPGPSSYGIFSQTGDSTPISATTSELTLIDGGVGTLSVPANGFSVGDSFRVEFGGLISAKNNDTLRIRIKSGSVVLGDSGNQTMQSTVNEVWKLTIDFTIRQIGIAGVASINTLGVFTSIKQSNGSPIGFAFNTLNNSTFDTTILNTLNVTAEWSSNSPLNDIYTAVFYLTKVF